MVKISRYIFKWHDWYTTPTGRHFEGWFVMLLYNRFWDKSCASECASQHNCKQNDCHRCRYCGQQVMSACLTFSSCKVNNSEQSRESDYSLKLLRWFLLSVIWFPPSHVICAHYSENYILTCEETPRELAIFCWLGRIYGFIYSRDVPSFSNAEALSELWPWGEWNVTINHWHQWEILHGHHVPLSIDHRTAVDLE